tara:strand:- start:3336 stop:3746 length:411 start_codon:yes stop_codon:yes gene_type:complete
MPRGPNSKRFRYHIHGDVAGVPVDCKCTSFNEFLQQYGGDKTPLKLHRRKLHRLQSDYYCEGSKVKQMWNVTVDRIDEPVKYVRADKFEFTMKPPSPPPIPPGHTLYTTGDWKALIVDEAGQVVEVIHDDFNPQES